VEKISKAAFRRLPRYHQILSAFEGLERPYISSREMSGILRINETLVRKDMADLQIRGRQNQGYSILALKKRIEEFLGLEEVTEAMVVGAGHLGTALATYPGFAQYGLRIVGLFDNDPARIGTKVGSLEVLSVQRLGGQLVRHHIRLVILTLPGDVAQEVAEIAVDAGVRAFWNFTPRRLTVPEGVAVRNEQIVGGFMALSHFLKNLGTSDEGADTQAPNTAVDQV
jgi:redox-sensing transcriptional repressor